MSSSFPSSTNLLAVPPRPRRPRQVDFNSRAQMYLVPSLSEYTDGEIKACFTNNQDNKRNQLDIVNNVTKARMHGPTAEGICVRGLEYLVDPKLVQERKIAKERHYDAILDEQDRQWDADVFPTDWDAIAKVSLQSSKKSRDRAQMMGAKDAVIARRINGSASATNANNNNNGGINKRRSSVQSVASHRRSSSFLDCSVPEEGNNKNSADVSTVTNQFEQLSP